MKVSNIKTIYKKKYISLCFEIASLDSCLETPERIDRPDLSSKILHVSTLIIRRLFNT